MVNSQSSTNDYYKSKISVLESCVNDTKYEDVMNAVKLYDNFRKMPMARRAKVDYEALKSQAQTLYSTLADRVSDSPAETVVERKGLISRMAGKARTYVIAGIAAAALAAGATVAYHPQISNYFKKPQAVQTEAPATVSATAPKSELSVPTAPKAPAKDYDKKPNGDTAVEKSEARRPSSPAGNLVELEFNYGAKLSFNPFDNLFSSPTPAPATGPAPYAAGPVSQDGVSEAYKKKPATAPAQTQTKQVVKPADKPAVAKPAQRVEAKYVSADPVIPPPAYIRVQKAEAAPSAPAQPAARNVPSYRLTPPTDSGNVTVKAIVNLEGYTDTETIGGTGTGKVTVDLGKIGFNAYANGFTTSQKFDTSDVDGNGSRFWASAHGYAPVSPKLSLYGELGGGIENRIYDVHFDSGSDFSYGDSSSFVNAKLGLTEGPIHNEDFGVGASHGYLLAQFTKNWGKATGDVKDAGFGDDYDATRASVKGRLMVAPDFSVEAGCAMFAEKFAEFLEQNYWTAQTGVRWHAGKGDGFVELLAVYQDMESTVVGNESNDKRVGPQVGAGWRVFSGDNVTVDTTASAGYLFSKEAENEWFANWGLTVYFGKKGK